MIATVVRTEIAVGITGGVLLTILGVFLWKRNRKEKIPTVWEKVGTLKELYLYPLKSGKGMKLQKGFCTDKGIKQIGVVDNQIKLRDRSFLIYKGNEVRTGRQIPKSVLIETKPAENGVILSAPNQTDIFIRIPTVKNDVTVSFGGEPFICTDCGDQAAKWISNYILKKKEGLRLGYGDGTTYRDIVKILGKYVEYYTNMDNKMTGIFSDFAALLIVNQASVDSINEKLSASEKVTFLNYRPNLVVEGPAPFVEDDWKYVKIGEFIGKNCMECLRCILTTVSPITGTMSMERQPLKTLEKHRQSKGPFKKSVMGIYLKVLQTGHISQGDDVYVSKKAV